MSFYTPEREHIVDVVVAVVVEVVVVAIVVVVVVVEVVVLVEVVVWLRSPVIVTGCSSTDSRMLQYRPPDAPVQIFRMRQY